jgi:hypothetical protein
MCCQDSKEVMYHFYMFCYVFEEGTDSDVIHVVLAMLSAMLFVLGF